MHRLKTVMTAIITNDGPLPAEYKDHSLEGAWADYRECHAGGDFLLIYKLEGTGVDEVVIFVRAGTHADLFE
jgi:mRNA interferase YafQ